MNAELNNLKRVACVGLLRICARFMAASIFKMKWGINGNGQKDREGMDQKRLEEYSFPTEDHPWQRQGEISCDLFQGCQGNGSRNGGQGQRRREGVKWQSKTRKHYL